MIDEGDGPLASVMSEIGRAMETDALVVTWHERDSEPMVLFVDGPDTPDETAERMLIDAAFSADQQDVAARSEWRSGDGEAVRDRLLTRIPTAAGVVTITGLFNRLGATTKGHAREAAARLMPMVQPFFKLWTARRATMSQVRGLTAAVNNSDVAILLVNNHGRLLFTNAAADTLIAAGDGLKRNGRMLSGMKLADTLRLQAAIEHVVTGADGFAAAPTPVVALTRKSRRPLLAAVVPSDAASGLAEESAAIVYICDPDQDLTRLVAPACKLYGLSPVETRLTCLLAEGICLADAAERIRVREHTARSYLKQIFLKTDTNRQAELVWLMLKSSVRTAPGCRADLV